MLAVHAALSKISKNHRSYKQPEKVAVVYAAAHSKTTATCTHPAPLGAVNAWQLGQSTLVKA